MPESPLIQKEVAALTDLESLIAHRAKVETEVEQTFKRRRDREEQEYRVAAHALNTRFKTESEALQAEYDKVRAGIARKAKSETQSTEAEYAQAKQKLEAQFKSERNKSKKASDETRWQALAMYEAARDNTIKRRKHDDELLTAARLDFEHLQELAQPVLDRCAKLAGPEPPPSAVVDAPEPEEPEEAVESLEDDAPGEGEEGAAPKPPVPTGRIGALQELIKKADEELLALETLKLPNFLKISNFIWPFLLLGAVVGGGLGFVIGWPIGIGVGVAAAVAAAVGAHVALSKKAQQGVARHFYPLKRELEEAGRKLGETKEWVKTEFERRQKEADQKREDDYKKAEDKMKGRVAEAEARLQKAVAEADVVYPQRLAEIRKRFEEESQKCEAHYPARIVAQKEKFDADSKQLQDHHRGIRDATKTAYDAAWSELIQTWTEGLARVGGTVDEVNEESSRRYLDWNVPDISDWTPPKEVPPAIPFGKFSFDLSEFPNGYPADPRLKDAGPTRFEMPAFVPFPSKSSILIKTTESGKAEANRLLQTMMIRFLTSIPPGKVRFTIFDPVGLGENFAAFMHLADYQELLVTSRIWTEAQHIEQRLADLSEHMENVIQKYLRNEFATIEEYNIHAGEVAEPFRVLVVANFPVNFNENAARRLQSIVASGARCGVYALISVDTKLNMPAGLQLKDLEAALRQLELAGRQARAGGTSTSAGSRSPSTRSPSRRSTAS